MRKNYRWILVFLTVCFIFGNSLLPGKESGELSSRFLILFQFLEPILTPNQIHFLIRKLAHFTEYFILGVLVINAMHFSPTKNILQYLLLFIPIFDETIQLFSDGRAGQLKDILIDYSGYIIGFILFKYLLNKYYQQNFKSL